METGRRSLMKKLDRAVEIIRGWSDEDLKDLILVGLCPYQLGLGEKYMEDKSCRDCWNEEVEECNNASDAEK